MTERTDTWMPFLVQKYLADTMHLSTEQHGAYLLLLIHAWMNDGALPIDADKLRRISRMDRDAWSAQKDDVLAFFHEQDGMLRQKRLDIELARAKENVQQRSAAGKASAAKRAAQREGQRNGNEAPTTDATTVDSDVATGAPTNDQRDGQQTGIPIPTPVLLKKNTRSSAKSSTSVCGFPPGFEAFWAAYPRKVAKDDAAKAFAKRKPDAALVDKMVAALQAQAASELWTKDGGRFVPYPATWLNRGQWMDEGAAGASPDLTDLFRRGAA